MAARPRRLLDQVRDAIRVKHYAHSTEKTYVYWAKRFVPYHSKRHPPVVGPLLYSRASSEGRRPLRLQGARKPNREKAGCLGQVVLVRPTACCGDSRSKS
jgi:hypothetical protein